MRIVLLFAVALVSSACVREPITKPILTCPGASELAAMMEPGETTSTAIVTELIKRSYEAAGLNVFITVDSERALSRARELDEKRRQGNILGPLHGVPLVVKDNIHVAGLLNTAGTPGLSEFTPATDIGSFDFSLSFSPIDDHRRS